MMGWGRAPPGERASSEECHNSASHPPSGDSHAFGIGRAAGINRAGASRPGFGVGQPPVSTKRTRRRRGLHRDSTGTGGQRVRGGPVLRVDVFI